MTSDVPVLFGFMDPSSDPVGFYEGLPQFVVHDFSIKEKGELTRKDPEFDMIGVWKTGGTWQGPGEAPH
jgi:hypothetical protein